MDPLYTGSELRDRLANERTLLAWIRTALALMAFGVALALVEHGPGHVDGRTFGRHLRRHDVGDDQVGCR